MIKVARTRGKVASPLIPPCHRLAAVPAGPHTNRAVLTGFLVCRYWWMDAILIWSQGYFGGIDC